MTRRIQRRPIGQPTTGTRTGSLHDYPITSERARMLPRVLADQAMTASEALALGVTTLRAVAVAYYGGDVERAKRAIYPPPDPATQARHRRERKAARSTKEANKWHVN